MHGRSFSCSVQSTGLGPVQVDAFANMLLKVGPLTLPLFVPLVGLACPPVATPSSHPFVSPTAPFLAGGLGATPDRCRCGGAGVESMGCSHAVPRVHQVLFMGHTSRTAIDHNFRDEYQPELWEFWPAVADVFKVPTEAEPAAESAGTLAGVGPGRMPIALNNRRAPRLSSSPRMWRHPPTHNAFSPRHRRHHRGQVQGE